MQSKIGEHRNRCAECPRCAQLKNCINSAIAAKHPQFWIHEQFNLFYAVVFGEYTVVNSQKDELFFLTRKIVSALNVLDRNDPTPITQIDMDIREPQFAACKTCPDHNIRMVAGYFHGIGFNYIIKHLDFAYNTLRLSTSIDDGYLSDLLDFMYFSQTFFTKINKILSDQFTSFDSEV